MDDSLQEQLYCAIGEAIHSWSAIESELCSTFCFCINPDNAYPQSSSFWAIASFEGKLAMVHAVAEKTTLDYEGLAAEWNAIHNRVLQKSKKRNMIAHGSVVSTFAMKPLRKETFLAPYYYKVQAKSFPPSKDGGPFPRDGRPANRMYLEDIKEATQNFLKMSIRIGKFNSALLKRLQEDHSPAT